MQAPRSIWPTLTGLSPQPVITAINTTTGDRVELSGPSLANAAAKIANALVLEFNLSEGDSLTLSLPWHWQRAAWQAGCLTAGVHWVMEECREPQGMVRIDEEEYAISLHPFGLPLGTSNDITPLIQSQPDSLIIRPALASEELAQALRYANEHAIAQGDRTLVCEESPRDDRYLPLLVPLVTQGSLVMGTGAGPWDTVIESEGITRLWA